jgi:hypothetical protein
MIIYEPKVHIILKTISHINENKISNISYYEVFI